LRIESLTSTQGFAVGIDAVTIVATVRNTDSRPVAAEAFKGRLFALSGFDYVSGDTGPSVPALAPGGSISFQWRLRPLSEDSPLVVSFAVDTPGSKPIVKVSAIPHLSAAPPPESASVLKDASARIGASESILENSRVRARVLTAESGAPIVLLSVKTKGGWRRVGSCVSLADIMSAEGGQLAWWEVFKADDILTAVGKGEASLILSGTVGVRWRGTVVLSLFAESGVIDVDLRIAPIRPIRLFGLRLAPFLVGDGSFGAVAGAVLAPSQSGPNLLYAVRWGELTVGAIHHSASPFPSMSTDLIPALAGVDYRIIGVECIAPSLPAYIEPGALINVRARIFALSPSTTVKDALKVSLPGKLPSIGTPPSASGNVIRGRSQYPSRGGGGSRKRGSSFRRIR
jgi:hypothetical protein